MLGTALQQSIQRFRHSVSESQRKQFEGCSLQVLQDEIICIQRQLDETKQLRDFNRLKNFLEAMTQIQTLAQELLDVSEEMGYILGPIQFALMEASSATSERIDILECLLDTYVEVGKVVPSLRQYHYLFESPEPALGVLEDYFCDILEFHRLILDVFARPDWYTYFDSAWERFQRKFTPILERLAQRGASLQGQGTRAVAWETQNSSNQTIDLLN